MRRAIRQRYLFRVFASFLAAALLPVSLVAALESAVARTALDRSLNARAVAAGEAFAERSGAIIQGFQAAIALLSDYPPLLAWLDTREAPSAPAAAALTERLLSEVRRGSEAWSLAVLDLGEGGILSTHETPPDWDMGAYADWGVFRRARMAGGNIVSSVRRRITANGSVVCLVLARAIARPDEVKGFVAGELFRQSFEAAAQSAGSDVAGARVVDPAGFVVFDLRNPAFEGGAAGAVPSLNPEDRLHSVRERGWEYIVALPAGQIETARETLAGIGIAGGVGGVLLAVALALAASRRVTKPVLRLGAAMGRIEAGDLGARVVPRGDDEFGSLERSFNNMASELERLVFAAVERQELLRKAELRSLVAQMDPHFLRNTLASIKSLAKLGRAGEIAELIARLGRLLRPAIEMRDETATLADSLERARDYLAVERVRLGARLLVVEDVDPATLGASLPSLALETLVENALLHGIERKSGRGSVRISSAFDGAKVLVSVEDDGPGMEEESLAALSAALEARAESQPSSTPDRGIGLANTARRLLLLFGPEYGLQVAAREGGGFKASFSVPLPLPGTLP